MPKTAAETANDPSPARSRGWMERLWSGIAERGRSFAPIPASSIAGLERAKLLTSALLSERGEASGAAISRELLAVLRKLPPAENLQYCLFLAENFHPDDARLSAAAREYLDTHSLQAAAALAAACEPPRQEVLRRINMAQGGTRLLVDLRKGLPELIKAHPSLKLLDADLRHLLASWFNRGFLELRRIDWQTSAAVLEKLIVYEAVHEIQGWEDLHRRLSADRRCFAFFHPALPDEPLIFVEVALVTGLAGSVQALLERKTDAAAQAAQAAAADTAIFYSISNCQEGLRGISFGNFLIKQVVEELRAELPGLKRFATLSPLPGFRRWLMPLLEEAALPELKLGTEECAALLEAAGLPPDPDCEPKDAIIALRGLVQMESWPRMDKIRDALRPVLLRLAAIYLTRFREQNFRLDPVARFHLGNGARLERINWMANAASAGMAESFGIMVNYLYDPETIEANHERFTRESEVVRANAVEALLSPPPRSSLLRRYIR